MNKRPSPIGKPTGRRRNAQLLSGGLLMLLVAQTLQVHATASPAPVAPIPTYIVVPPATIVQPTYVGEHTPLPTDTPSVGGTSTPMPPLTTVSASATAVPPTALPPTANRTATMVSLTATTIAVQGTVGAIQATQTAIAATQTALVALPTGTPTSSSSRTATAVPCGDLYEDDGLPQQAKPLVVGQQQEHSFCPAGDADWVSFFASKGKGYRVTTSALSVGVDTYLLLFAADGHTLLATNDEAPGQHGPSEILFYPNTDGWYFVQAKNAGDVGFAGSHYTLGLTLVDVPTATATITATTPPATSTPQALPTQVPTGTLSTPIGTSTTPTPDSLLHPQGGSAATAGLPVFIAGPQDGMSVDFLEPSNSIEQAPSIIVGATYQLLNFVSGGPSQAPDIDYYAFRTKPGNCYALRTGDLSPDVDTTLRIWQMGATREERTLLVGNDDTHPHTADLSSSVRWCNPITAADSLWLVAEVRNYGGAPTTDPRGKTYSLVVQIDPPTPTPTATVRPTVPVIVTIPAPPFTVPSAGSYTGPNTVGAAPTPTRPAAPTPTNPPAAPAPAPGGSSVTPTATPQPRMVSVDLVAYFVNPRDPNAGPAADTGVPGLMIRLVDLTHNRPLQDVYTDANGAATLKWAWTGAVQIRIPQLQQSFDLHAGDLGLNDDGSLQPNSSNGHIYRPIPIAAYPLPVDQQP